MSRFDEVQAAAPRGGSQCSLCPRIEGLNRARQRDLRAALADGKYSGTTIVAVLSEWGVETTRNVVERHRPTAKRLCATYAAGVGA